jgi:hypothetical protein
MMRSNAAVTAGVTTHEGAPAKRLTVHQELRRTVLSCLLWENTFYEKGNDVADRLAALVLAADPSTAVAVAIEAREQQKLRHVPLFIAVVLAGGSIAQRREVGALLARVIQRADELTEVVALYWKRNGKRCPLSAQMKRGLAKAFQKFPAEQLAKYNRDDAVKLRDVMFLVHPQPALTGPSVQADAFKALANRTLAAPDTWEVALSAGADKKATWERLLTEEKLGALALLRNLRNMQTVGVNMELVKQGLRTMRVERVLPFRFIAAARYAPTLEPELEGAMFRCLQGLPKLPGRTALIVDTSASMWQSQVSAKSDMSRFEAAAALAMLCREACEEVLLYTFAKEASEVPARRGFALRDALATKQGGASRGGLAVEMANRRGYDRIIVITDGQWHYSRIIGTSNYAEVADAKVVSPAPRTSNAYMLNVGTYATGVGYGKWIQVDGWSEQVLSFIRAVEQDKELLG